MQLAFSTNAFVRHPLTDALKRIRQAGFSAAEILADVPHAYPDTLNASQIREIVHAVEQLDLRISNINANCTFGYFRDPPPEAFFEPSLISSNRLWREDRLRMIGRAMELGHALGCPNISITSGRLLGSVNPSLARTLLTEGLRRVMDLADRHGVRVGIECEPGLCIEYGDELEEWIRRIGHPHLGANLDIGHSQVLGEDIPQTIRRLQGHIWNLHVEDIPGRKHYHMIPGDGTLNWHALRDVLAEVKYDRFITVELYTQTAQPDEAARRSHQFLSRLFA